jgi:hypothetical protein
LLLKETEISRLIKAGDTYAMVSPARLAGCSSKQVDLPYEDQIHQSGLFVLRLGAACRAVILDYQPEPTVLFSQNKPATSQQYFFLRTNQQQPSATGQTNRLDVSSIFLKPFRSTRE